jgi:hypothetical protein
MFSFAIVSPQSHLIWYSSPCREVDLSLVDSVWWWCEEFTHATPTRIVKFQSLFIAMTDHELFTPIIIQSETNSSNHFTASITCMHLHWRHFWTISTPNVWSIRLITIIQFSYCDFDQQAVDAAEHEMKWNERKRKKEKGNRNNWDHYQFWPRILPIQS